MKKIVILGGGESGYGSALLAQKKGFDVFLSDGAMLKNEYKDKLVAAGINFEQGGHTESLILAADIIVKSPGIPEKAAIIQKAYAADIPIISEIEFATRYTNARKICITGSNGKTTTTTLIYEIMRRAGMNVAVAGNIGQSFAYSIATAKEDYDWYVIELSSFQLDGVYDFHAEIALLLNITPDHLDRYDYQMENYVKSKLRVIRNQTDKDFFIYNADDPQSSKVLPRTKIEALPIPFSVRGAVGGAWFDGTLLHYQDYSIPAKELKINGLHNIANALAAIAATIRAGVPFEKIAQTLREFTGVEHRLEVVSNARGAQWINDSKATNVDSVWYALQSMTRPTIWIAGGTDKGNDYSTLKEIAKEHCKALICMGVDNTKLINAFQGVVPLVINTHSIDQAMHEALKLVQKGDTVLLSPACASFDLFNNYEDRGRQFKSRARRAEEFLDSKN